MHHAKTTRRTMADPGPALVSEDSKEPSAATNAGALAQRSVLARKFIPQSLREPNEWPLTSAFPAASPQESEASSRIQLVPAIPACYCNNHKKPTSSGGARPHEFPHRKVKSDFYYAVQQAGSNEPNPLNRMFHVDNIAGIDTYRIVWEAILATERLEILHRYENYSQYGISISGPFGRDPFGREKSFEALLEIHGIADANPPLMIGDTVLVRPLHRVSLPLKPHEHPPPRPPPPPQPPIPINRKAAKKQNRKERRLAEARMALAMGFQQQMHMFGPHLSPQEQFERQQQFEKVSIQRQQERQQAQIQILRSLQEHHPDNYDAIQKAMHGLQWSPPVHVAEIQGKILSLQRAGTKVVVGEDGETKKHNDRVTFSWPGKLESDTLMFTFREAAKAYGNDMGIYNVRFVPSQSKLERCLTALDWLVEAFEDAPGKAMELLFPTSAPVVAIPSSEAASNGILAHSNQQSNQQLNDNQASFVSMVLGRTKHPSTNDIRGPMVLSGPAGTGKTKAMLSAIRAVLDLNGKNGDRDSKHRCLVCTPSHTAADVVTRRLGQHLEREELFRLYDSDRPVATVPVEVLQFCRQSEDESGTFVLPDASTLLNFQVIVCTCSDAHLLYQIGLTNQQLRVRRGCLHAYLKKTCDEANLEFVLLGADECHFTHLFVDEAAQASEPETLIPLSVVADPFGKRKVEIALVGDPRQLSPAVYSNQAAEAGLKKSWMERLLQRPVSCLGGGQEPLLGPAMVQMEEWLKYSFRHNGQEQLSVFLTLNYRGHPSFLMMPSVLFYADKLQSIAHEKENAQGESFWCEKMRWVENLSDPVTCVNGITNDRETPPEVLCRKQFDWPLHFRGVVGRDTSVTVESGFASSSWANEKEAEAVVDIVVTLSEQGVLSQSIGVMAPFRGQVVLIRKLLRAKRLGGVNVGSVEDYQAVEHDVIVLSLTRSTLSFVEHDVRNRMGVFGQPKRSNVAMTRAEFLFIVVGNPTVLVEDFVWRQFLLFCHRNGLYYGERLADESILRWDADKHLVRCRPSTGNSSLQFTGKPSEQADDCNIVAVGTLERLLRKAE